MRIFAIGDIHGQADRLTALLARLAGIDPEARFVFLGDYLDRGANSRKVIDELIAFKAARQDSVFLMGNHEVFALRYESSRDPEELRGLRAIGFQATQDSYPDTAGKSGLDFMPEPHREFLHALTLWHQQDGYVFFHAPLPRGVNPDLAGQGELEMLLSNRTIEGLGWDRSDETLVFGHVPVKTPLVAPGLIGIDTAAGYGRVLTAVELPDVRFHHA